jgi:AcrR family transcriptional regulator
MSSERRTYQLKARAESQALTRERITQAASELHREVGPARTTVAEIARRAGVQRLTVYNNFPTDRELFEACGAHWLAAHPPPDFGELMKASDPACRLDSVLAPLYAWFRETESMTFNIERDRLVIPTLNDAVSRSRDRLTRLAPVLAADFSRSPRARQRASAMIALAFDFWTWRRLAHEGLNDRVAADLMVTSVRAAAAPVSSRAKPDTPRPQ